MEVLLYLRLERGVAGDGVEDAVGADRPLVPGFLHQSAADRKGGRSHSTAGPWTAAVTLGPSESPPDASRGVWAFSHPEGDKQFDLQMTIALMLILLR